ncbi:MAG: hypothetical protein RIQ53_2094 [Pseudomonadota bacterium]
MIETCYRLTFNTPAFLGNADQEAQWRTPPIKALLRQWWRVVYAAEQTRGVDVAAMRQAEGELFGHAWLESDKDRQGRKVAARRSAVRLRLSDWSQGNLTTAQWKPLSTIRHPEVTQPVGADLYLGFGPLVLPRGQRTPALKAGAAIQAGKPVELRLAVPPAEANRLRSALGLMNLYGTLGGRSRNGWGSFSLQAADGTMALPVDPPTNCMLPWKDALIGDWPQALGSSDGKPLIWQTNAMDDWHAVMVTLAKVKVELRTQFRFPQDRPDGQVHDRHWLSYPVTRHDVSTWKRDNLRLPNSLRFKVRADANGKLRGVIFHMPCLPPPAFNPVRTQIERVWQQVHQTLDGDARLQRSLA